MGDYRNTVQVRQRLDPKRHPKFLGLLRRIIGGHVARGDIHNRLIPLREGRASVSLLRTILVLILPSTHGN